MNHQQLCIFWALIPLQVAGVQENDAKLSNLVRKETRHHSHGLLLQSQLLPGSAPVSLLSAELLEVANKLAASKEMLPISVICSELKVDANGCVRLEEYLGTTLATLTTPMHLEHQIDEPKSYPLQAIATTRRKLGRAKTHLQGSDAMRDFAASFDLIPDSVEDQPFIFAFFDSSWRTPYAYPTFNLGGPIQGGNGNHVIGRVYTYRFDAPRKQVAHLDVPFEAKMDSLVWRGKEWKFPKCNGHPQFPNRSRTLFLNQWRGKGDKRLDIGGDYLKLPDMLKHKFVLVLDGVGHASATSLEWVLASNSVPFMNVPVTQTWFLQSRLTPWKHYVPLADDFSDVAAKLDWAISNPTAVASIASEGKAYMEEFSDIHREERIHTALLVAYFNRFKIQKSDVAQNLLAKEKQRQFC